MSFQNQKNTIKLMALITYCALLCLSVQGYHGTAEISQNSEPYLINTVGNTILSDETIG